MPQTNHILIGNRVLDLAGLPEAARQELLAFYDFLVFKYQERADISPPDKKRILSGIFKEADGTLPENYTFDREALHER